MGVDKGREASKWMDEAHTSQKRAKKRLLLSYYTFKIVYYSIDPCPQTSIVVSIHVCGHCLYFFILSEHLFNIRACRVEGKTQNSR